MNITREYCLYINAFCSIAEKFPQRIAVVDDESSITYADLNKASDIVASRLITMGAKTGDRVVMYVPRIKEAIVGALAIWKAGCVYVPVDDEYPTDRIDYMVGDAGAMCVCTVHSLWNRKPLDMPSDRIVFLDHLCDSSDDFSITKYPECTPEDDALVIYTSGSTGKPKGVLHTHLSFFSLANWQPDTEKPVNTDSRFANLASFSFIACITDLFSPLLCGGSTFIVSRETVKDIRQLHAYLCRNAITNILAPVRLAVLLLENFDMRPFEMRMGGERVTRFRTLYPTMVTQEYGSSEGCFTATCAITGAEDPMPLGIPNSCIETMILNDELEPVAPGETGEFSYCGPILAKEYLNQPELTAKKWFVRDGKRWFLTGDLVREGTDGMLYYIQRKDFMVKINGFRVELGEIENNVLSFPGVEEAVCIAREVNGGMHLCCYFAGSEVTQTSADAIREHIAAKLPAYMQPSFLIYLDRLPRNANGKLDRLSLPDIDVSRLSAKAHAEPENDLQRRIRAAFAEVLGIDANEISIDDSFFDLGGNSILTMLLLTRIDSEGLNSMDVFKGRTVRVLSEVIQHRPSIQSVNPNTVEKEARALPHALTRFQSKIFADQMVVPDSTVWNVPTYFRLDDRTDADRLCRAVNAVLHCHSAFATVLIKDTEGRVFLKYVPEARQIVEVERLSERQLRTVEEDIVQPFEIFDHPLYRIRVFRTEEHVYLFMDTHHLLMDGTAIGIMSHEIVRAYEGLPLNSKDYYYSFLSEQEKVLTTDEYRKAETAFREQYGDLRCWRRMPDRDFDTGDRAIAITGILPCGLNVEDLAQAEEHLGTSRNVLSVAAALIAMYRQTGEADVMVSWIYNNRSNPLYDDTVGSLNKELPVALRIFEDMRVSDLIESIKKQVVDGISGSACEYLAEHYVPFETDTMYVNYLGGLRNHEALNALGALSLGFERKHDISKTSMGLAVFEQQDGRVFIGIEYCSSFYKHETACLYHKLFEDTFIALVRGSSEATVREII